MDARAVTIGIVLLALVVALDWMEIQFLSWHRIDQRLGVLMMIGVGQLLLAGTFLGDAIRWGIDQALEFLVWTLLLIPWPPNGAHMTEAWAKGLSNGALIVGCTFVIFKVTLGFIPSKISKKGLDWTWVYAAALIPILIFGLPIVAQGTAKDISSAIADFVFQSANSKV